MNHIKSINEFFGLFKSKIKTDLRNYGIKNYTINNDGTIDVDDNVGLYHKGLSNIPFKFGRVTGYFDCSRNELTSLEGCPKEVVGYFTCDYNKLKDLIGGPQEVGGSYHCDGNQLETLEGCAGDIGGSLCCANNKLELLDCASIINDNILCSYNTFMEKPDFFGTCDGEIKWDRYLVDLLKSLHINNYYINDNGTIDIDGDVDLSYGNHNKIPLRFGIVTGSFDFSNNQLTSLEGCPRKIGGSFDCSFNLLINLIGGPETVESDYICSDNRLETLDGLAIDIGDDLACECNKLIEIDYIKVVGGDLYCSNNLFNEEPIIAGEVGGDIIWKS